MSDSDNGPPKKKKKNSAPRRTFRCLVDLKAGGEGSDDYTEVCWYDLVAKEEAKNRKAGIKTPSSVNKEDADTKGLTPYASDDDDQLKALAAQFESKYAEKPKKKGVKRRVDCDDLGDGYDESDPFIDNSECFDENVPQYSCLGLLSSTANGKTRVFFYTDKDVDFLQLDTEGVPEFQVLRCDTSRLARPVLDLQALLAAYSTDLFTISVIRDVEDSIMLYCDQPLAEKHADCQICRALHINLHWHKISDGELWSGAKHYSVSCQCPFYDVKLLKPYYAGDSRRRILLAEAVNLPPHTQTVRLSFDKQSSSQSCIGSAVLWKGSRSFVGVSVDNNKILKVPNLCQVRCVPSCLSVSYEQIEALLCHPEIYPDNPECNVACLFILRSTQTTQSRPLPASLS